MGELRKRTYRDKRTGELKESAIWTIRYYRNGRRYEESTGTKKKGKALDILKIREGDGAKGLPVTPQIGRLKFDEAAADVLNDYRTNGKRSADEVDRRIRLHLQPWFGGRRMVAISTADVRAYIAHRQAATTVTRSAYDLKGKDGIVRRIPEQTRTISRVSNGEINRELTILRRMFSLAIQGGKLLHKPYVPLLREENTRAGFFEPDQFRAVLGQLPAPLRPVAQFAYITGWRIASEVLPLEWRQVDFRTGEVRLDAGTTKNGEGRVFPMTDDLRMLLESQHRAHLKLKKAGKIEPWVFFRMVADERGGKKEPRPIVAMTKAWNAACLRAGCPGRIPHDLRRTAVRNMVRRGVPERVAMQLTGHKTRSIFERYNIVSACDLRTAAEQLGGLMGTVQGQSAVSSHRRHGATA